MNLTNIYTDTFHIKLTVTIHLCNTKQAYNYNCSANWDIVLEIQIRSLIRLMYDVIICFFGPSNTSTWVQSTIQRNINTTYLGFAQKWLKDSFGEFLHLFESLFPGGKELCLQVKEDRI